ncbi:MAG: glycosyltransferase [bacterium]|nr:glycosyltransferase [bacterium]
MKKPLTILLLGYDWRDIYTTQPHEVLQKLRRDHLNPDYNHFFTINWSHVKYHKKISEHLETVHLKARFAWCRPLYDMITMLYVPIILRKYKCKPDIVIAYDFPMIISSWYPRIFLNSKSILFLTNLPRDLAKTRSHSFLSLIYHIAAEFIGKRLIDYVCVINETTRDYIRSRGIADSKIHLISPNTISRDKHLIENVSKGTIRKKYGISEEKKILLTVGRMEPEKNFAKLITLFSKLSDTSHILLIVGYGSEEQKLKQLVSSLGLEKRVIFAGQIQREEIWDYYSDSDIFILLSNSEALGLVFWEAMYMHVPVIGSPVGGILETIGSDGERGYLWDEKEGIESLEHKITTALQSMTSNAMKERAHQYIVERIQHAQTINDIVKLHDEHL